MARDRLGVEIAIPARRKRLSARRNPAGSTIAASTPRQADVRIIAPAF
jgi:hypothetical protein